MERVTNSDELRDRLQLASGESIIACGWGVLGLKNVFVGVTPTALCLEFISMGMKTKEIRMIPFGELEFIFAVSGEATKPKLLKMNLNSQINELMAGTLIFKLLAGDLTYLIFRKMLRYEVNNKAPFRITDFVTSAKPELVHLPDLSKLRESGSRGGCFRRFLLISAIIAAVLTLLLGFLMDEEWEIAAIAAISTAVVFGGIFAPLIPVLKRMLTGKG